MHWGLTAATSFLDKVHGLDVAILTKFSRRPWWMLRRLAAFVSHSGDGHLYGIITLVIFLTQAPGSTKFLLAGLIAFSIELPVYFFLKKKVGRPRPKDTMVGVNVWIVPSDQFSFPSGHTAAAFLMATLLAAFFPSLTTWVFSWAVMIGLSRLLLTVHFPTDILAGALLGLLAANLGLSFTSP
tara:strand:- start:82 stop:630 length:549 start_codon:yes stop_codon:yes gene_type:complete